jgi:MoaA/NifB/PqqE/SkfB family radical SAM enzyme
MSKSDVVNIRYVTDYPKCNYSCVYCIAGHGEVTESRLRHWNPTRYLNVIENVARLPFKVNIRLGVAGEFFLDKTLIKGAAWLSHQENIDAVNLITNLSFKQRHFSRWLSTFDESKVAMVASYHPSEIDNKQEWISTAKWATKRYDFSVVVIAFPRDLPDLENNIEDLRQHGLEVFVQPFIGVWEGRSYPEEYSPEERQRLKDAMYSRHDVEFLLNLKKPGMCNAGYKSLYVGPLGDVFPCGMGHYKKSLGNLAESHKIELASGPELCQFSRCQCDTENMNTTQFEKYYRFDALNQHKYHYRFSEQARFNPRLSEWEIEY